MASVYLPADTCRDKDMSATVEVENKQNIQQHDVCHFSIVIGM